MHAYAFDCVQLLVYSRVGREFLLNEDIVPLRVTANNETCRNQSNPNSFHCRRQIVLFFALRSLFFLSLLLIMQNVFFPGRIFSRPNGKLLSVFGAVM